MSPGSLRRLRRTSAFSLFKSTTSFLSHTLFPFLKHLFYKTLDFFSSMDPIFFPEDEEVFDPRSHQKLVDNLSELDSAAEPLYFVPFRWWNEAREAVSTEITGVMYETTTSVNSSRGNADDWDWDWDWDVGSEVVGAKNEIILNLRRQCEAGKSDCAEEGFLGGDFALVSEWMFFKALIWQSDVKGVGSFLATKDNSHDLFPLHIRLSFLWETDSLVVKINQKDNEVGAFNQGCNIFCIESGLLRIWDFSGQTSQYFTKERKLPDISGRQDEEISLELQVFGLSCSMKGTERNDERITELSKFEGSFSSRLLKMNGSNSIVNSHFGGSQSLPCGGSYKIARVLGLTGLYNLGNTCFMNSAIQCLVHTPTLVDYFLGDFRIDLNFGNPLGMNGKLALAFGDLLRKLWAPGATPVDPGMFKSTLAGFAPQFSGYNQHDSQEFLAFLLDGLHEDLNRVKCKPYIAVKDAEDRPDEEVADEHWRNHLTRNDSIIVDACQGQYLSTLFCPMCKKKSITFDPFMYLSLPLPSMTMRKMTLTVLSTDGTTLPSPVTITVPNFGRCKDLVQALSSACSLGDDEMLFVAEIYNHRILHSLDKPSDSVELIRDNDRLVAYRFRKDSDASPMVVFIHQREEKSFNRATPSLKKFGIPLVARMSDFSKGSEIRKQFLKLINAFLTPVDNSTNNNDGVLNTSDEDTEMEDVIKTPVLGGDTNADNESEDVSHLDDDFQFYLEGEGFLSKRSKIEMDQPVPVSVLSRTINVLVTWPDNMMELYDTSLLSSLPEICKSALLAEKPQESVNLYKCLEAFLKEEPLGPEDMWYCPNCKRHRQASKTLDLWRLPEILIIHLKRFSYNRYFKNKLETYVDFPINDFDLSAYVVPKNSQVSHHYMLYAVSNHSGVLGGGHYTAFVQHGPNRWYNFDDSRVSSISEEQIKTSAAYVLFYKRV
ncbi:unnamed protein product [Ilex paraguariensis]|uniref:Ubiquitin carboxyl-terminal hydrolase n=1 Tax=Ilex paraguariensis TaxID=185542 RepID=A0ABC8SYG7_9AQUA